VLRRSLWRRDRPSAKEYESKASADERFPESKIHFSVLAVISYGTGVVKKLRQLAFRRRVARDNAFSFPYDIKLVRRQIGQCFFPAIRPQNFRPIEVRVTAEAEMDSEIVLR